MQDCPVLFVASSWSLVLHASSDRRSETGYLTTHAFIAYFLAQDSSCTLSGTTDHKPILGLNPVVLYWNPGDGVFDRISRDLKVCGCATLCAPPLNKFCQRLKRGGLHRWWFIVFEHLFKNPIRPLGCLYRTAFLPVFKVAPVR